MSINPYISAGEHFEEEEHKNRLEQEEDHVLQSLFEMTGIQSALQHDQIINSDTHDAMIVEREGLFVCVRSDFLMCELTTTYSEPSGSTRSSCIKRIEKAQASYGYWHTYLDRTIWISGSTEICISKEIRNTAAKVWSKHE